MDEVPPGRTPFGPRRRLWLLELKLALIGFAVSVALCLFNFISI